MWTSPLVLIVAAAIELGATRDGQPGFGPPELWAKPIESYLAVGAEQFPDGYFREIHDLAVFGEGEQSRLWIGYGDATRNMGSVVPVEFRSFDHPDDPAVQIARVLAGPPHHASPQGAPQRTPGDTGEEHITNYRTIETGSASALWLPGIDSTNADEAWTQRKPAPDRLIEGNVFRLEEVDGEPAWRKYRSIPGGEHVHDIVAYDGALWAVGSGADHRREWEGGQIFRYLWKSEDDGASFTTAHRVMFPELGKGDTRYRQLLVVGQTLYAFGYVNPFVDGGPLEGRHIALADGVIDEVDGPIGSLVVWRTNSLSNDRGLVVTRETDTESNRVFAVDRHGFREVETWSTYRVLDLHPAGEPGTHFVLAGSRGEAPTTAVFRFHEDRPERLELVLELGERSATAIALWYGDLFIGTSDGRILRARGPA